MLGVTLDARRHRMDLERQAGVGMHRISKVMVEVWILLTVYVDPLKYFKQRNDMIQFIVLKRLLLEP